MQNMINEYKRILTEAIEQVEPKSTLRWNPGEDRPVVFQKWPKWVEDARELMKKS